MLIYVWINDAFIQRIYLLLYGWAYHRTGMCLQIVISLSLEKIIVKYLIDNEIEYVQNIICLNFISDAYN